MTLLLQAIGLGALLVSASVIAAGWAFARLWCRPARSVPTKDPGSLGLTFEVVRFPGQNGHVLRGWFVPGSSQSTVILLHGWSKNASQVVHLAPIFAAHRFSVLLFDSRGHGRSDGDGPITIRKFAEDLRSAVDYLEARSAGTIGVFGHSIGASAALLAAADDARIRAVASSSAFADPTQLTARVMEKMHLPLLPFLTIARWFIERWLNRWTMGRPAGDRTARHPPLLIHGEGDRFIPPSDFSTLRRRATTNHLRAWLVPRRDHSSVLYHPELGRLVVEFMEDVLSDGRQTRLEAAVVPAEAPAEG
jgi:pimeloyl-ACP methyl ester carboxylesterase